MEDYKQIIVIRKDLNMRKGKMVAQGSHASMAAILNLGTSTSDGFVIPNDPRVVPWLTGIFKKIVVGVNSEEELLRLSRLAKGAGLITALILDSGLTEFKEPTYTAVAIGPDTAAKLQPITGNLILL